MYYIVFTIPALKEFLTHDSQLDAIFQKNVPYVRLLQSGTLSYIRIVIVCSMFCSYSVHDR